jgi:hypothetical protein
MITLIMFGLLFVGWVAEWPLDRDTVMYTGKWRSFLGVFGPLFNPVPGISLFPWQILLLALAPFCLAGSGPLRRHSPQLDRAIFLSVACILVTFLWGWGHGGSAYFAYYQVWRFLAALLIAYMLMSLVRSEGDLVTLGKLVVVAALLRATVCIYYFWTHLSGKVDPLPEYVTNHDDSLLFVLGVLIVLIGALLKGGRGPWTTVALVVPCLFYAMMLNKRRIAWVELGLSLLLIYTLMGAGPVRSRINRWAAWSAPLVLTYIAVGWGSDSSVFAPVHALLTTGSNDDPSSLTRQEEVRNLLRTLVGLGNPIFGTGWGLPYNKMESLWSNYDADWILTLYTPHNSLLGLATYAGLVGIIGIWGVVPMGAYLAARGCRATPELVPRTAGMIALGAIAVFSVHCYGDIGFQSFTGSLLFGAALATIGKVAVWSEALPAAGTARSAGAGPAPARQLIHRSIGKPGQRFGNGVIAKPRRASTRRSPR